MASEYNWMNVYIDIIFKTLTVKLYINDWRRINEYCCMYETGT